LISAAIYEYCKRLNKNLSIAWTDYQGAFDSFPHSWLETSIEIVGVNKTLIISVSLEKWNTGLHLKTNEK
jgi:hypothetical protein